MGRPRMSENVIETLTELDMLEGVRLLVHDQEIEGVANSKIQDDDRIVVVVSEREGDRKFRIQTQWASGWLEPLVDVLDASADDSEYRPEGTLRGIESTGYPTA